LAKIQHKKAMKRPFMDLALILTLPVVLSACAVVSPQAVYEEIRAQEKAKAVGSGTVPGHKLPPYDAYQKERSVLSP
jgi:hypothetical protein